jgi:hypothetical protein
MYSVDHITEDIVTLQDMQTKELVNVTKDLLPANIHDGSLINFINNEYSLNESAEEQKRKEILAKFNKLKE